MVNLMAMEHIILKMVIIKDNLKMVHLKVKE